MAASEATEGEERTEPHLQVRDGFSASQKAAGACLYALDTNLSAQQPVCKEEVAYSQLF